MLTEVKAYSSWRSAPTLLLDADGRIENDLIWIASIEGLDPVKASISTSPFGSIDGASHTGSSVLSRNIVLTLKLNPDWNIWTYETLRRLIYSYFMPKLFTQLEFYSDDMVPTQILGIVEDASINIFSKDPEIKVSIICPDPYFQAIEPTIYTGQNGDVLTFNYDGSIEAGIVVKITSVSGPAPTTIDIQIGDPKIIYFGVEATVDSDKYFEISSIPMRKYVQNIDLNTGVIDNLLSNVYIQEGSPWPTLQPGENKFQIITDDGIQDYLLIFYERFGGL